MLTGSPKRDTESPRKKEGRGRKALVAVGAALAVAFVAVALSESGSGKIRPMEGEGMNGKTKVVEKTFVDIDGSKQGMIIRSANVENPVLLFVHGGPGMPEYFLEAKNPTGLDEHFTVCWWEQRGAGLSYVPGMDPADITLERLVDDAVAVTDYLRARFGKEKIYLLGHSWGSIIGVLAARKAPEKYHAYFGMGQIADQPRSERESFFYMVDEYSRRGDLAMAARLGACSPLLSEKKFEEYLGSGLRDAAMHKLGVGSTRSMRSVVTGIFFPALACREYTLRERINVWRAKAFLAKSTRLREECNAIDFMSAELEFELPVYFLSGRYDYTVSWELSKEYLDKIVAPRKAFFLFEDSAHSPLFEEPGKFVRILREIASETRS